MRKGGGWGREMSFVEEMSGRKDDRGGEERRK